MGILCHLTTLMISFYIVDSTKEKILSLGEYAYREKFNANLYGKNLEKQQYDAKLASYHYDPGSVNDQISKLQEAFNDPERMPQYDAKGHYWQLSSQFSVEDNEAVTIRKDGVYQHPFLD